MEVVDRLQRPFQSGLDSHAKEVAGAGVGAVEMVNSEIDILCSASDDRSQPCMKFAYLYDHSP